MVVLTGCFSYASHKFFGLGIFLLVCFCSFGLTVLHSPVPLFILLSLQTVAFTSILSSVCPSSVAAAYFVPSIVGGLLWLLGSFCSQRFSLVIVLGLLLKLGLFPFQGWGFKVALRLGGFALFCFLVPLKVGPLYLLLFCSSFQPILGLCSFLIGIFYLYVSSCLSALLFGSSLVSFFYFLLISPSVWFFYFFVYAIVLSSLCSLPYFSLSLFLSLLSLGGLAPLALF